MPTNEAVVGSAIVGTDSVGVISTTNTATLQSSFKRNPSKSITSSITLHSSFIKTFTKTLSNVVKITSIQNRIATYVRQPSQSITISQVITIFNAILQAVFNTISLTTNQTRTATYNRIISNNVSPLELSPPPTLALDGSATEFNSIASNSFQITLSTTYPNDVIILFVNYFAAIGSGGIASVTSSNLTFRKRIGQTISGQQFFEEWYAIANSSLNSETITVTWTSGEQVFPTMIAFGIRGADTTNPFDTNASLPSVAVGLGGSPSTTSINTSNANDFIFGLFNQNVSGFTPGSGFTQIQGNVGTSAIGIYASAEYKPVNITQTNLSVNSGNIPSQLWGVIADAVIMSTKGSDYSPFTKTVTKGLSTIITRIIGTTTNIKFFFVEIYQNIDVSTTFTRVLSTTKFLYQFITNASENQKVTTKAESSNIKNLYISDFNKVITKSESSIVRIIDVQSRVTTFTRALTQNIILTSVKSVLKGILLFNQIIVGNTLRTVSTWSRAIVNRLTFISAQTKLFTKSLSNNINIVSLETRVSQYIRTILNTIKELESINNPPSFALDGASGFHNRNNTNTHQITFTTSNSNILVVFGIAMNTATAIVSSVTVVSGSNIGLAFTKRANFSYGNGSIEEWYAVGTQAFKNDTIQVIESQNTPAASIVFGITGANVSTPFPLSPYTSVGSSSIPTVTNINTANVSSYSFVFAIEGENDTALNPAGLINNISASLIKQQAQILGTSVATSSEYIITDSQLNGVIATFASYVNNTYWGMLVDSVYPTPYNLYSSFNKMMTTPKTNQIRIQSQEQKTTVKQETSKLTFFVSSFNKTITKSLIQLVKITTLLKKTFTKSSFNEFVSIRGFFPTVSPIPVKIIDLFQKIVISSAINILQTPPFDFVPFQFTRLYRVIIRFAREKIKNTIT